MRRMAGVPYVDPTDLDAWGKCDITGLPTMYRDLVPQMEYEGTSLYWTGLMVNAKDLDDPQPQLCMPPIRPDPVPVVNPRYFPQPKGPAVPTGLKTTTISSSEISLAWNPVEEATNYAVSWVPLGPGIVFSTLPLASPSDMKETRYTIMGLSSHTSYIIRVASLNDVTGEDGHLNYNISAWSTGDQSLCINTL
jgi:hypothetical protein